MSDGFTEEQAARHDALFAEAFALIEGEILIHGDPHAGPPGFFAKRKLNKAVERFREVLEINPDSWQAMWGLGKIYQRLGEHRDELGWFRRAYRLNPEEASISREAARAAMDLGQAQEAVGFCESALAVEPDDPGLQANYALALMLAGRHDEAHASASAAAKAAPDDPIAQSVLRVITEVRSGERVQPETLKELEASL